MYLGIGRQADASLLRGLGEYFSCMAMVEEVDPRAPDPGKLQRCAVHLEAARGYLRTSAEFGRRMLEMIPRVSSALAPLVRPRLEAAIENETSLERGLTVISQQLNSGRYPIMADCVEMNRVLGEIVSTFKINAQTHRSEGF